MSDKLEPRFNPESIRESVQNPKSSLENGFEPGESQALQPPRRGSGLLLNLVLLILVLALGGLGWLLLEQRQALEEAQQRLSVLESRLAVSQDTLERSGDTLQEQLALLQEAHTVDRAASMTRLDELQQRVERETSQRESIEQQQQAGVEQLNDLAKRLAGLAEPLAEFERMQQDIAALQQQVADMPDLFGSDDSANDEHSEQLQQLTSQVAGLTEWQQAADQELSEFKDRIASAQRQYQSLEGDIKRQFSTLEAELAARQTVDPGELGLIEIGMAELREDIRAINNARQLINRDLLQLREQLNRLQLMLN